MGKIFTLYLYFKENMFNIIKNVRHNFFELNLTYGINFFYLKILLYLLFSWPPQKKFMALPLRKPITQPW